MFYLLKDLLPLILTYDSERSNSANAPLFKLPSELRNRIWNFVFDVGGLHISYDPYSYHRFTKKICITGQHESEAAQEIRNSQIYDPSKAFIPRHHACIESTNWKAFAQILNVLKVSRQVHAEAALLPYQLNTFYFNSYDAFTCFRDGLGTDHRRAARSVAFNLTRGSLYDPSPPRLHDMDGIQDISLFLTSSQHQLLPELTRSHQGVEDLGIPALKELLRVGLDLQSVSVTIYPPDQVYRNFQLVPNQTVQPHELEVLKSWSMQMETKLLKANEHKVEKTEKRTRSGKGFAGGGTKKRKTV